MRFSVECAFPHLRKRDATSRKGALWPRYLTEKRTLYRLPHGTAHFAQPAGCRMRFYVRRGLRKALFRESAYLECVFPSHRDRRMRLSVRPNVQNVLFRRVRLSSPAQTSGRLTERRSLCPPSHGKAHFDLLVHSVPHQKAHVMKLFMSPPCVA